MENKKSVTYHMRQTFSFRLIEYAKRVSGRCLSAAQLNFGHKKGVSHNSDGETLQAQWYQVNGRNDGIWTHDLFHPKEALYQAGLRPDTVGTPNIIAKIARDFKFLSER